MSVVEDVVHVLNYKLIDGLPEETAFFPYLKHTTTPIGDYIEYLDVCLWDSENDPWEILEQPEAFEAFLIEAIKEVQRTVNLTVKVLEGVSDE